MSNVNLTLAELHDLARGILVAHNTREQNAEVVSAALVVPEVAWDKPESREEPAALSSLFSSLSSKRSSSRPR